MNPKTKEIGTITQSLHWLSPMSTVLTYYYVNVVTNGGLNSTPPVIKCHAIHLLIINIKYLGRNFQTWAAKHHHHGDITHSASAQA